MKCRDANEYNAVQQGIQRGEQNVIEHITGAIIPKHNQEMYNLDARIQQIHPSTFFEPPYEMTLSTSEDTIGERVQLPLDATGQLDVLDDTHVEYRAIIQQAFRALDADCNQVINSADFSSS